MVVPRIKEPPNVLVLCHGNRFRSPLAGAVLSRALGADKVRTAGLSPSCRGPAALKAREFAAARGYDLSGHRSRTVVAGDVVWAGLVLLMDPANFRRYDAAFPDPRSIEKARSLGLYVGLSKIPDPGFLPRCSELDEILDWVIRASEAIVRSLVGGDSCE